MTVGRLHHQSGLVRRSASEAGIALGPILFIIAIIAILAGVIAAGVGGFNASTSTESAKAAAYSFLAQGELVKHGFQTVYMGNSCDESLIDFSNPSSASVSNASTPSDGTCKVFDPRGGGIGYPWPIQGLLNPSFSSDPYYGTGVVLVDLPNQLGTGQNALFWYVPYVNKAACDQINIKMGISTSEPYDNSTWYAGNQGKSCFSAGESTYTWYQCSSTIGSHAQYAGMMAGCIYTGGNGNFSWSSVGEYDAYYVIYIR